MLGERQTSYGPKRNTGRMGKTKRIFIIGTLHRRLDNEARGMGWAEQKEQTFVEKTGRNYGLESHSCR
jgi:hypothetical protein